MFGTAPAPGALHFSGSRSGWCQVPPNASLGARPLRLALVGSLGAGSPLSLLVPPAMVT